MSQQPPECPAAWQDYEAFYGAVRRHCQVRGDTCWPGHNELTRVFLAQQLRELTSLLARVLDER